MYVDGINVMIGIETIFVLTIFINFGGPLKLAIFNNFGNQNVNGFYQIVELA